MVGFFSFLVFVIYLRYSRVAYKQKLLIQRASRNAQEIKAMIEDYAAVLRDLPDDVLRESLIKVILYRCFDGREPHEDILREKLKNVTMVTFFDGKLPPEGQEKFMQIIKNIKG